MLILNCTSSLLDELDIEKEDLIERDQLEKEGDELYHWHANFFRLERRKCLLLMNVASRCSIFFYGLKKPDFADIEDLVLQAVRENFVADRVPQEWIDRYFAGLSGVGYSKTYSRSVLGCMNDRQNSLEFLLDRVKPELEGRNVVRINKRFNRTPILSLETSFPLRRLWEKMAERFPPVRPDIYRFRVQLSGIKPPVWRRIELPGNYTFWDLHMAIQESMGWENYHLFSFRLPLESENDNDTGVSWEGFPETLPQPQPQKGLEIGLPQFKTDFDEEIKASWSTSISDYFGFGDGECSGGDGEESECKLTDSARYVYDFGDHWEHEIELEKISAGDEDYEMGELSEEERNRFGRDFSSRKYPLCTAGSRAAPPEDCGGVGGYEQLLEVLNDPDHPEHERMRAWAGEDYDPEYFDPEEVEFSNFDEALPP